MNNDTIGIGVIGYGYWGPNLVRNFAEAKGAAVRRVVDQNADRLDLVRARYPYVRTGSDFAELIGDPEVHAIVVATPTETHCRLAMQALAAGKHVLVEKPLAMNDKEASMLVDEAERRGLTLMVDHTFIYTPAVRRIRQLIAEGHIGDVLYYDATRINLGLFQSDVDVVWDLAVHDLSILDYLLRERPVAISAIGKSHVSGHPANVAYMTLTFASNAIAHINVNWLAPVKIRRTIIGGSRKMIVFDDLEPSEKIKIFDKGIDVVPKREEADRMRVGYRLGDMWAPQIDPAEALGVLANHFIDCIRRGVAPETPGAMGRRVVRMLEAANRSMGLGGQLVSVDQDS